MPLIDLQTNLKSLKYGSDRLGGGDSGLPYIKTDINTVDEPINRLRLTRFDDGLIRGGAIGALNASIVDTLRIGKFLTDLPKGPLFIAKQVGLQLSNPRLEVPKNSANIISGIPDNPLAVGTNGLLQPTRIYNLGINTIAQIPVNAFGGHFNRHGILPVQNENSKYEAVVTANNNDVFNFNNPSKNNRLVTLTNKFKLGDRQINQTINRRLSNAAFSQGLTAVISALGGGTISLPQIRVKPTDLIIDDYAGGPSSVYGVGRTTIKRYSNTEDGFLINRAKEQSTQFAGKTKNSNGAPTSVNYFNDLGTGNKAIINYDFGNGIIPFGDTSLVAGVDQNVIKYSNPNLKKYADIKKQIDKQKQLQSSAIQVAGAAFSGIGSFNYNQFGVYKTDINHTGSKGGYSTAVIPEIKYQNSYIDPKTGKNEVVTIQTRGSWNTISREQRVGSGRQDSINLTPIFDGGKYDGSNSVTIDGKERNIRDLVRFRIQAVDTNSPDNGKWMIFRAYLTNLSDDTTPEWNDVKYIGRGEKFYVYNGFTRKINISFKVAALSVGESRFIYQKLNFLMSNAMPDYNENGLMRGPLVRMSIGNWIDGQLGKLDSISYNVPQDSPWEISLDEPEGGIKTLILPHIVEVTLGFTPIGSETRAENLISRKSDNTSNIAQNNTGEDVKTLQYITGSL